MFFPVKFAMHNNLETLNTVFATGYFVKYDALFVMGIARSDLAQRLPKYHDL